MSGDIGNAFVRGVAIYPTDWSHCDSQWFGGDERFQPDPLLSSFSRARNDTLEFFGTYSWASPWWPAGGMFVGDAGADVSMLDGADWWGDPWILSGCNGRLAFVGITRTASGVPVGGMTVRCFRTSSVELVSTVLSDANGYYVATTPYADGHFLTTHKATSPPIAGATIDTLTPG